MRKFLLMCMTSLGVMASAQIFVNEGFEGTALPTGWASTTTGTGTTSTPSGYGTEAGTVCEGSKAVYKNIYKLVYTGWNLTYTSAVSNGTALNYSFKYLAKPYNASNVVEGTVSADYSIDGGVTWVDVLAPVVLNSPTNPIPCTTVSGTIPAGVVPVGADFRFRLKSTSSTTADFYMGFDDVKLSQVLSNPPVCTTVSAPAAAATAVSVTPTITWASAAYTTGYTLNLGTTPGGTDVINGLDVGNVTSYVVPAANTLNYSTQYYVTVIPKNNIGSATGCASSSFTTRVIPCPSVSAPSSSATGTSLTPAFTWSAVTGATGYKLSIGTTTGGTDILNNSDLGNVLTYTYSLTPALNYNTKYFYTLNSYSASSNSTGCTERNFTTKTLCPTVTAPSSNATGASLTPTFTWTANTDATGYRISIGTTAGATDILNNVDVGNVLTYVYNGSALNYNTKYFYTVNAYNGAIASVGCTERNFTTITLCPTVSAPANSATGASLTPTFTWAAVQGATGYRLTVGTTAGGSDIVNNFDLGNVTTYVYNNTALNYNVKYFYTINAYSGALASTSCTERNFTTMAFCPVVSFPATNATNTSPTPTISWVAVSNAIGYRLSVGTATGGVNVLNNVDLGNVTSYTFQAPLNLNTAYFYTVNAYTSNATSASCVERKFTTTAVAPPLNDECSGAVLLTVNSDLSCVVKTSGTTVSATASNETAPSCGASGTNDDVWYKFNATSSAHRIVISDVSATTDMAMAVYSGSCGSLVNVQCSDPNTMDLTGLTVGQEYKVRVWTWVSTATTTATFNICVGTPPPPPANDDCSSPMALTPGATFAQNAVTATTVSATLTSDATAVSACQTTRYSDTWYSVVVPASGSVTIETATVSGSSVTDTVLAAYTGSCGTLTSVGCNDDIISGNNFSRLSLTGQIPGTVLLVAVWNYSATNNGTFLVSAYDASLSTSESFKTKNDVKVYPNPFTDVLNISDVSNVKSISVVDISGKLVKTFDKPESTLHLGGLNSGMYLVVLNMKDGSRQTIKAIKK